MRKHSCHATVLYDRASLRGGSSFFHDSAAIVDIDCVSPAVLLSVECVVARAASAIESKSVMAVA